jgi:putative transposase
VEVLDPEPRNEPKAGVDLGLIDFIVTSDGEKVPAPKYLRRAERRLKIRQRRLSRKAKGSQNREKARQRVALQHEKVANQRKDFQHKQSHHLVADYGWIVFEHLNIAGMLRNHNLAKSISDAGWGQFVRFCEYKAAWTGGTVEKADRFFPSTRLCSACDGIADHLRLSDRMWVCLDCGAIHDRDENAAINLLKQSTAGAAETHASGDTIPVRGSAQEAHQF